jgi:hypothetical protein
MERARWIPSEHFITKGIPFEIFPYDEMAYYPYEAAGDVIIRSETGMPIAAVKEYGKGRIVAFGYYPRDILPQHADFKGNESTYDPIIENLAGSRHSLTFNYLEHFYGLIYRSMIWASRKESDCAITAVNTADGGLDVTIQGNKSCAISYRVNNAYDEVVYEGKSDNPKLPLPEWLKSGGEYRVDVFAKEGESVADWWTAAASYPLRASVKSINLNRSIFNPGDTLKADVEFEGPAAALEVQLIDDFDRVLATSSQSVSGNKNIKFEYVLEDIKTLYVRVRAILSIDGHMVQKKDTQRIVVTPADRKLTDFEVFMCPQNRGQGDFWMLQGERFRELGVTGLFTGSTKTLAMSGAEGLGVYWYHRMPYVERKEKYLRTKDKKYLQRVPCLNDPQFWENMGHEIFLNVGKNKKYGPVSYFANDEGSLTCYTDELELCFCPHCMGEFRKWLKTQYKDLAELNSAWGTEFKDWEEAVPYTAEEARKKLQYASWGDHRSFMEHTFVGAYKKLCSLVKEADPQGVIRMSGCQSATAYSGYDYYRLHQYVGYFEAYPSGNQYEYDRSFAKPDTIMGGWFGYGAEGMSVKNRLWNAIYHGLTLVSIFWEYCCLNPDFTFSRSAVDMSEAFKEIKREGIGKLLLHGPSKDSLGIAVHYSMPSIHGSYIVGDNVRFERNREGWINALEDMGYQYNFVATQQIEAGELIQKGYKLLILPYSIALSDKEAEQIREFAENGGTVLGDFQTGLMDEHCKLYEKGKIDDLLGIERLTADAKPFYINSGFVSRKDFPYFNIKLSHTPGLEDESEGLVFEELGTRETTGKAAYTDGFMNKVASVVVNEYKKGKGIYLNFALNRYPEVRAKENGGKVLRNILKDILILAGINKPLSFKYQDGTPVEKGFETFYYNDGDARYIGLLKELGQQQSLGHDGLAVGAGTRGAVTSDRIEAELLEKVHVYDIRQKKYIGFTDNISFSIESGDTKIFALLPCKVDGINISMEDKAARGEICTANIAVASGKPENAYGSILNIKLFDPRGEYAWIYSENVSISGSSFTKTFRLPYNEMTGRWKLVVKDVATGVQSEREFEVI